ncbi:MAG: YihY/virulence factor BrkB family protein [Alphaproteobacteria bacterium]|nr:YihY/virulence factor BrkB family protein [Alphaproteobacteria bacterium]MCW5743992.1 YihY/virulence factor BrkB family protein [Alphaproteobacteria bacterium]
MTAAAEPVPQDQPPPPQPGTRLGRLWRIARLAGEAFIDDDAFSRGASIAYFTLFSIAPVLLVVIAIAGLAFGREAAQGALVEQLSGLMGAKTALALQEMIRSADESLHGVWATVIGLVSIVLAISGVFVEVQSSLNRVWEVKGPRRSGFSRLLRARLVSLGLVVALGFVLIVSLATSAALTALSGYVRALFPALEIVLGIVDLVLSLGITTALFAAMYKVLPDAPVAWREVLLGAAITTVLFAGGKYLIALYIGNTDIASSFGAAGAMIVLLLWIFYSSLIFLLGAEFTWAWAQVTRRQRL